MAKTISKKESTQSTVSRTHKSRKRAADLFDDPPPSTTTEQPHKKAKTTGKKGKEGSKKKSRSSSDALSGQSSPRPGLDLSRDEVVKELKATAKNGATDVNKSPSDHSESEDSVDKNADEQDAALLAGFDDSDEEGIVDAGFEPGKPIPKIDKGKELTKKLKKAGKGKTDEPGVVYIGRIPHGFHEHEMRAYFSQFGTVQHVRLSRSKKSGNSKHYAFLQFESLEVAKIAAETMNNYLLFGHILKCHIVPKEQVHDKMWVGADKRFKKVPWNKIEGRSLGLAKGRSEWERKIANTNKARQKKIQRLRELGYDFELPKLKRVESVAIREPPAQDVEMITAKENGDAVPAEEKKSKKKKKSKV